MKGVIGIIVHDIHTGEPIFINASAVKAIKKINGSGHEYSVIFVGKESFSVKELFNEIMQMKMNFSESEDET